MLGRCGRHTYQASGRPEARHTHDAQHEARNSRAVRPGIFTSPAQGTHRESDAGDRHSEQDESRERRQIRTRIRWPASVKAQWPVPIDGDADEYRCKQGASASDYRDDALLIAGQTLHRGANLI